MIENPPDLFHLGYAFVSEKFEILFHNLRFGAVFGNNAGSDGMRGKNIIDIFPEIKDSEESLRNLLASGTRSYFYPHLIKRNAGIQEKEFGVSVEINNDSDQYLFLVSEVKGGALVAPASHLAIAQTLKQKGISERALKESDSRFAAAFKYALTGRAIIALDGRFLEANRALVKILGRTITEIMQIGIFDVVHGRQIDYVSNMLTFLSTNKADSKRAIIQLKNKIGEKVVVDASFSLVRSENGAPNYFIGDFADITVSRETQRILSNMISNLPGFAFRFYMNGNLRVAYISDGCEKLVGYSSEQFTSGKIDYFHNVIYPRDRDEVSDALNRALKNRTSFTVRHRVVSENGEIKWVWKQGRYIGEGLIEENLIEGFVIDITDQKVAEERQRLLARKLLMAQEEERRKIALDLHDDLGQRLTAIRISLEMQLKKIGGEGDDIRQSIMDQLDAMALVVRELSGKLRPNILDRFGLHEALVDLAEGIKKTTGINVTFSSNGINGMRFQTEIETVTFRIVQEAINNALKHSLARKIQISIKHSEGVLYIVIKDNGVGFNQERIRKKESGKTGLWGIKERAELVDGTAIVYSEKGVGTKISVEIPATENVGNIKEGKHEKLGN